MQIADTMMPRPERLRALVETTATNPIVMVNLLNFKTKAAYPDGTDAHVTGRQAYLRYAVAIEQCLAAVGGRAVFSGDIADVLIGEVDDLWDMVALIYYPSPRAMLDMVALPAYREIEIHRIAGLASELNIRMTPGSTPRAH